MMTSQHQSAELRPYRLEYSNYPIKAHSATFHPKSANLASIESLQMQRGVLKRLAMRGLNELITSC